MTNPYLQELQEAEKRCTEVIEFLDITNNMVLRDFFSGQRVGLRQAIETIEALPDPRAEGWDAARTALEQAALMDMGKILDNNPYRKDTK